MSDNQPAPGPSASSGLQVTAADERVLVLADRLTMEAAEPLTWAKRIDAFGTLARMSGLLGRGKEEEVELVYRERRLQPFWRIVCAAHYAYERTRQYTVKVAPEVASVQVGNALSPAANGQAVISGLEACREDFKKEALYDALTKAQDPALAAYLTHNAEVATAESLAALAEAGTVVVPPSVKASNVAREVLASAIPKIEADRVLEEAVRYEAVDLYYRPVYAFRFRRGAKEAVVEVDGLTREAKPGGATFEQYLGKVLDPRFLLEAGVETVNLFVPGAKLAQILVEGGIKAAREISRRE